MHVAEQQQLKGKLCAYGHWDPQSVTPRIHTAARMALFVPLLKLLLTLIVVRILRILIGSGFSARLVHVLEGRLSALISRALAAPEGNPVLQSAVFWTQADR